MACPGRQAPKNAKGQPSPGGDQTAQTAGMERPARFRVVLHSSVSSGQVYCIFAGRKKYTFRLPFSREKGKANTV